MADTCSFSDLCDQAHGDHVADISFYVKRVKHANPPVPALACVPPPGPGSLSGARTSRLSRWISQGER